jgi:hypothetical protein
MTKALCWKDECKYLTDGSVCGRAVISLDEDGECENFEDYHDDAEWQTPFWKRMFDRERNQECRVKYIGKEIETGGRIFYIEINGYYASITDKETGLKCGDMAQFDDNVDIVGKIKEAAKKYTSVMDLPIAVYDEKTRKFSYPDEESEDTK